MDLKIQTSCLVSILLILGLIHVCFSPELEKAVASHESVNEFESTSATVGITIKNETSARQEQVHITKGESALDALRKVAAVETKHYPGLGDFITSIDGLRNENGKYWMWYIWDGQSWMLATVGACNYSLMGGENIKFSYETPSS